MATPQFKVYVLEDDDWYSRLIEYTLNLDPELEVRRFPDARSLLRELHHRPDVITLDFKLPDMQGDEVLRKIKELDPGIEVIVISEQSGIETAVNLLKLGAYDYIVKSDDIRNRLLHTIYNIRKKQELNEEVLHLRAEVGKKYEFQQSIIGKSPAIRKVFTLIEKAALTNIPVSITGETGTGKEVVAKAIHYASARKNKPFVAVNMAAIPRDLVESELFGHEKGAFTGAIARRVGKFEEAHQGTLFLDEIGEMELVLQAKLLRALQEQEIVRIGSNQPVKLDCRIIVASNRNLAEEIKKGNFREDLYYRLLGLPMELPPLREREGDVMVLADHFVKAFCKDNKIQVPKLSPEAREKLLRYHFPGNVRELKSIMELAVVMSENGVIRVEDITLIRQEPLPVEHLPEMTLHQYTMRIIHTLLEKYDHQVKTVAKVLDIGQSTIYRMLKEEEEGKS